MNTITKQFDVYEFDELSDESKEKVLQKFYEINVDYGEWYEFTLDDFREMIKKEYGLDFDKVYFNLEYRYRTLNFDKIWIDNIDKFIKGFKKDKIGKKDINFSYKIARALREGEITISFDNSYRCGEGYTTISYSDYTDKGITDKYSYLEDLQEWFNDIIVSKLLGRLTEEYEYLTSQEQIIETIKANEYKFLENGEVFN